MVVVGQGRRTGGLCRSRDHEPGVLAHGPQELDQLGVPGVEADAHAGQVRALGERVHRHHAVASVLEHRAGRAIPGELGVALVGEDRNAVRTPPGGLGPEVPQATGRVRRRVRPQHQGPRRVGGLDGVEIEAARPSRRGRHAGRRDTRPAPLPWRTSDTRRPGTAPCPSRLAQAEHVRHGGDQLLGPHAGGDRRHRHLRQSEAAGEPFRCRLPQLRAARGGGVAALGVRRRDRSTATRGGGGSHGVPMEQSTMPPSCASASLARPWSRS